MCRAHIFRKAIGYETSICILTKKTSNLAAPFHHVCATEFDGVLITRGSNRSKILPQPCERWAFTSPSYPNPFMTTLSVKCLRANQLLVQIVAQWIVRQYLVKTCNSPTQG